MPEGIKKFCKVCSKSGRIARLKRFQISFEEAIYMCEYDSVSIYIFFTPFFMIIGMLVLVYMG